MAGLSLQIDIASSPEHKELLNLIDQFREIGVGEFVPLPQICVIGNQNSGKSSVLKRLTRIPFPVDDGLCTRFATEVISRKSSDSVERLVATILPSKDSSQRPERRDKLQGFKKEIVRPDQSKIVEILALAAEAMGIVSSDDREIDPRYQDDNTRRFSDDVLRIEISGPKQQQFSIIDLPGLFHSTNKQQTKEDLKTVERMVRKYIKEERTIIMAVMDGQNDDATQAAFEFAKESDKDGVRTIGVITKCDRVELGNEGKLIELVKNKRNRLELGWFLLKNWSKADSENNVSLEESTELESEFFAESRWSAVDKTAIGIDSLKKHLGTNVASLISNGMDKVIQEVKRELTVVNADLVGLGIPRDSSQAQRLFLNAAALDYDTVVRERLSLPGQNDLTSPVNELQLRRLLLAEKRNFQAQMKAKGAHMSFKDKDYMLSGKVQSVPEAPVPGAPATPPPERNIRTPKDKEDIYLWLRRLMELQEATELPDIFPTAAVRQGFLQQSSPWKQIAVDYIQAVEVHVRRFNSRVMDKVLPDPEVRKAVQERLEEQSELQYKVAHTALQNLIEDERAEIMHAQHSEYSSEVSHCVDHRTATHGQNEWDASGSKGQASDRPVFKFLSTHPLTPKDKVVYALHDHIKTYYDYEINIFMMNVIRQVVERCLVGRTSALRLFSSPWVLTLDDAALKHLAGETKLVASKRRCWEEKQSKLEEALKQARKYAAF